MFSTSSILARDVDLVQPTYTIHPSISTSSLLLFLEQEYNQYYCFLLLHFQAMMCYDDKEVSCFGEKIIKDKTKKVFYVLPSSPNHFLHRQTKKSSLLSIIFYEPTWKNIIFDL